MLKSVRDHRVRGFEIERVCVPSVVVKEGIYTALRKSLGSYDYEGYVTNDTLQWLDLVAIDNH